MNQQYTLPKAKCPRCKYEWTPRKSVVAECPKCKRYLPFPDNVTEEDKSKYFGRHFDVAEEVKDASKDKR